MPAHGRDVLTTVGHLPVGDELPAEELERHLLLALTGRGRWQHGDEREGCKKSAHDTKPGGWSSGHRSPDPRQGTMIRRRPQETLKSDSRPARMGASRRKPQMVQ